MNPYSNSVDGTGTSPTRVLCPGNVQDLREIVLQANRTGANLTLASSTGTHRKGGIEATEEHVRIDLSSWNHIPWINRRNRVCMIQPGVTYGRLLQILEKEGMTVSMPLAPRNGKSVLASVMDREPCTWPNKQWDASDPVASTECMFGSGALFRTGAGGGPGSLEQQRACGGAQKYSGGPSQTDLHRLVQGSQGTLGAVTWITLRTELKPTIQRPFLFGSEALAPIISFVYEVQRPWLGEHSFVVNRTAGALLMSEKNREPFHRLYTSLPEYICLQNIAGFNRLAAERVSCQEKDIREIASRHTLKPASSLGLLSSDDLLNTATRPCGEKDWREGLKCKYLSLFFLTTLDRTPTLRNVLLETVKKQGLKNENVGIYIQPVVQNHACHVEFIILFDSAMKVSGERARELEREAVRRLAAAGAFFSRPYGFAGETVFKQNPEQYALLKKVKSIFDPNRVLNRGKWDL